MNPETPVEKLQKEIAELRSENWTLSRKVHHTEAKVNTFLELCQDIFDDSNPVKMRHLYHYVQNYFPEVTLKPLADIKFLDEK